MLCILMNNKDLFIYLRVRPEVSPVSSSEETTKIHLTRLYTDVSLRYTYAERSHTHVKNPVVHVGARRLFWDYRLN